MGVVSIAEIRQDMVLAADLVAHRDRLLFRKGTRLTQKNLQIMKTWGVVEVDIEGISQKDLEENILANKDPELIRAVEDRVRRRFIHARMEHPAIQALFRLRVLREAEQTLGTESDRPLESRDPEPSGPGGDEQIPLKAEARVDPTELLRGKINLSTLPTVYMHLNEAIHKPTSSASGIANVINKDTNLSAKLLKIVNSAFYGFPYRIDTLSRAVAIVGTNQLSTLALGVNVIKVFKSIPQDLIDMKSFWKHSIGCGIIARILASHQNVMNTERLFVAGLIHDIGRLLMYNYTPNQARIAILEARRSKRLLHDVERQIMNLEHASLGAMLLKKWQLPVSLENITRHHHTPTKSSDPFEPSIVHLADLIITALGIGSSGETFVPPLDTRAWELTGLSPNVLSQDVKQVDRQVEEAVRSFCDDED
ncbi:MAG: HDOD domain-containing protein [Thermodesulfobacteriota bacterium]